MAIQKIQIHELVYEKLQEIILSGQYKEGDYLPSEPELAAQIGASRSALRSAMLLLRKLGIVEVSPGKGTIIKKTTFPGNDDPVLHSLNENKEQIIELMELRIGIEAEAAALAAERATDEQIAQLRTAYLEMEKNLKEGKYDIDADVKFHVTLVEITGNKLFLQVTLSLADLLRDAIIRTSRRTSAKGEKNLLTQMKSHKRILIAIEQRDKNKARQVVVDNLERYKALFSEW